MISITQIPRTSKVHAHAAPLDSPPVFASSVPIRQLPPPRTNRILASIKSAEFDRIVTALVSVKMSAGEVLYEQGCKPQYVYFPTTAIVSLVFETPDGASSEICAVGNDGVVGFELFTGGDTTCNRAIVTNAGHGYRLEARHLNCEFGRMTLLISEMLRCTQTLVMQIARAAFCNRHHSVEQQLCRRLLFSVDHLPTGELLLTHEQIAHLLGVRRESVTAAAHKLQSAGAIRYLRGRIEVLDRPELESRACDCYKGVIQYRERRVLVGRRAVDVAA